YPPAGAAAFSLLPPQPAATSASAKTSARPERLAPATAARRSLRSIRSSRGERGCVHAAAELEAAPATRFVEIGAADDHAAALLDLAIGAIGRRAAHHADRQRLGDVLGDREQLRHGLERHAAVVLIEAGHDHALPLACQRLAHLHEIRPEELPFVDADDL